MPKNGRKVNDWETLRPYVEEGKPPEDVYLHNIPSGGAGFFSEPDIGFGKAGQEPFLGNIVPDEGKNE